MIHNHYKYQFKKYTKYSTLSRKNPQHFLTVKIFQLNKNKSLIGLFFWHCGLQNLCHKELSSINLNYLPSNLEF